MAGPGCLHVSTEACQNLHMGHEQSVNKRVLGLVLCPSIRVPLSGHRELCAMCKCQGATRYLWALRDDYWAPIGDRRPSTARICNSPVDIISK